MNKLVLFLSLLIAFTSCGQNSKSKENQDNIISKKEGNLKQDVALNQGKLSNQEFYDKVWKLYKMKKNDKLILIKYETVHLDNDQEWHVGAVKYRNGFTLSLQENFIIIPTDNNKLHRPNKRGWKKNDQSEVEKIEKTKSIL